jgi:hypothetical protein
MQIEPLRVAMNTSHFVVHRFVATAALRQSTSPGRVRRTAMTSDTQRGFSAF